MLPHTIVHKAVNVELYVFFTVGVSHNNIISHYGRSSNQNKQFLLTSSVFWSFALTVQRNISLIPLKRIHAHIIPQNAVVAYHMRGCDVIPPVDHEQHFFLHVFCIGGMIFPAGQMAEVRSYGQANRFRRSDCIAVFIDGRFHNQSFDPLVFRYHQIVLVNPL